MTKLITSSTRFGRPVPPTGLLNSPAAVLTVCILGGIIGALLGIHRLQAQPDPYQWDVLATPTRQVLDIHAAIVGIDITNRAEDVADAALFDQQPPRLDFSCAGFGEFPDDEPGTDAVPVDYALRDFITAQTQARYSKLSCEDCEAFADACMTFDEPLKWCARGWAEGGHAGAGAVNRKSGCSGWWQISPCHKRRMARLELDFTSETDRTFFAHVLDAESGNAPWVESEGNRRKYQKQLETAWAQAQKEGE